MADDFQTRRGLLLKRMHRRIESDPTLPVRRTYDEVICIDSDDSDELLPLFDNVRSRLKRYRSRFMPPIPLSVADVNIENEWKRTWKGKQFLTLQDNNLGVVISATKKMIKTLLDCICLYIDGTFKTSPNPFEQMVTIHGLSHGHVIPLTFCLLTSKTVLHYRTLLSHIKAHVLRKTGQVLAPARIVIDFEAGLRSAVLAEFPQTIVSGCFFHYCSSLWRKVQKLGLSIPYRRDASLKKTIRMIMAIAFISPALVRFNFNLFQNCLYCHFSSANIECLCQKQGHAHQQPP
jgi:MULE transposase domain